MPSLRKLAIVSPISTLLLLIGLSATIYFAIAMSQRAMQMYQIYEDRARLESEIGALEERERVLLAEKQRIESTDDIEAAARQKLNLVRPGEVAVVVLPAPGSSAPSPASQRGQDKPFWQQWFEAVFGR